MAATIAVTKERRAGETRAAATPDSVKRLKGLGFDVVVEAGAGAGASIPDAEYADAGATIAKTAAAALKDADILFKVRAPEEAEIKALKPGTLVVALLNPYGEKAAVQALAEKGARA